MGGHGIMAGSGLLSLILSSVAAFVAIAVAFAVLVILVRLMLVATKALQVYIRINSAPRMPKDPQPEG